MKLNELKVGDKVIVRQSQNRFVKDIKRLTNTQIVLHYKNNLGQIYEEKYNRESGSMVGSSSSSWGHKWISVPKDGEVEEVKKEVLRKNLILKLEKFNWESAYLEKLLEVESVLQK